MLRLTIAKPTWAVKPRRSQATPTAHFLLVPATGSGITQTHPSAGRGFRHKNRPGALRPAYKLVEMRRLELLTPSVQRRCSSN